MTQARRDSARPSPTRALERRLGDRMRARLPHGVTELTMFVLKLGWASLFGGLLLIGLIASDWAWDGTEPFHRYDALFLYALALQALFLALKLESWDEARVIVLFHLTGTAMEFFKVHAGSWTYPEPGLIKILGVPLFSGFMYASVGSFMARAIRLFDMTFRPYPAFGWTVALAAAIYVNFFAHHFVPDARYALFAATALVYWRTWVVFHIGDNRYRMPFVMAGVLTSVFMWIAENIGTRTNTWLYPGQEEWHWVSLSKMGSWYLLIFVSFVTVSLVYRDALIRGRSASAPSMSKA